VKFLDPLYTAVAWVMAQIHAGLSLIMPSTSGQAWFLTIILLVVFMRLLLVPLFIKQMHSMRKMAALAPQLQELRKKYKGDKQTLNEETMRVYRENGVNPLGGCLPLVAQLPVFFALFNVLRGIADWKSGPTPYGLSESVVKSAQNANILGAHISDKVLFTGTMHVPLEAKIVILCFVTISVITTFMTVRQNTKRGLTPNMTPDNPMAASQKYMAYIVPFFALSGLYWAFGLVLYWVTTNVWTLGQQWVLFKRYPAPVPGAAPADGGTAGTTTPGTTSAPRLAPAKPSPVSRANSAKSVAPKSPGATKPSAPAKPGGAAGASASTGPAAAEPSAANPSAAKRPAAKPPAAAKSGAAAAKTGAAAASGQASRKKKTQAGPAPGRGSRPASTAGQQSAANGSGSGQGLLRRLGRKAPEPEPEPETPEVKIVRQQRVRQSRSKRSGKR
jgi:YidC/Oxa1 family membrane protein insertase